MDNPIDEESLVGKAMQAYRDYLVNSPIKQDAEKVIVDMDERIGGGLYCPTCKMFRTRTNQEEIRLERNPGSSDETFTATCSSCDTVITTEFWAN